MDYRANYLRRAGVFHTPNDAAARESMEKSFAMLTHHEEANASPIEICGRMIPIIKQADDVIWFDFDVLCNVPRSQQDYLALAEQYKTVFISHVAAIPLHANDRINLFIRMIDVFYDAHVRVIISSAVPADEIYREGSMASDFKRTHSRLLEMQSEEYLKV
jgi:cell division protein ZapE